MGIFDKLFGKKQEVEYPPSPPQNIKSKREMIKEEMQKLQDEIAYINDKLTEPLQWAERSQLRDQLRFKQAKMKELQGELSFSREDKGQ
jgi:hypothetical protein